MKRQLRFVGEHFCEITEDVPNPFRGWYRIYSFRAQQKPDFKELIWCIKKEETCAMVLIDISAYANRDLDETAFENIQQIFHFFDEQKKDILLRIVYDREGKCTEHEPSVISRVIAHIEQLRPLLQKYRDRIVFFEGMLVGNWGEMHGSRFLTKKYMMMLDDVLKRSAQGIIRAVRRPVQWRMLQSDFPDDKTIVALYNDAIFGSDTDLGTFADDGCDSDNWEAPWPIQRELEFENRLGEFVPQCGEAVYGENCRNYTLDFTVERLRKMHLTCLNSVYDERILNLWKDSTWNAPDIWMGINGYDYIGRHLGYRFCIRNADVHIHKQFCEVEVMVENIGFSGFYQEAQVYLIVIDEFGEKKEYLTDWDVREWKSGQIKSLTWKIPCCEGRLYLFIRRKWDRETIRFANQSAKQGWLPIGSLEE